MTLSWPGHTLPNTTLIWVVKWSVHVKEVNGSKIVMFLLASYILSLKDATMLVYIMNYILVRYYCWKVCRDLGLGFIDTQTIVVNMSIRDIPVECFNCLAVVLSHIYTSISDSWCLICWVACGTQGFLTCESLRK